LADATIAAGERVKVPALKTSKEFSGVRKIVARSTLTWDAPAPFANATLAKALLTPTSIYVKPMVAALKAGAAIKGLAHITGGGLTGNVPRALPDGTRAVLDAQAWRPPAAFQWLREVGKVPTEDMLDTFNLGLGMVVVVAASEAKAVAAALAAQGETPIEVGRIEAGDGEATCSVAGPEALWRA